MGVLLALSTIFIWGRLVNIDCDLKDISEELKKMNESIGKSWKTKRQVAS